MYNIVSLWMSIKQAYSDTGQTCFLPLSGFLKTGKKLNISLKAIHCNDELSTGNRNMANNTVNNQP